MTSALVRGMIAVDLDGTLAQYDHWRGPTHIGEPIPAMARRVEGWLNRGIPVVIFTARLWTDGSEERTEEARAAFLAIQEWTYKHFGIALPVTNLKLPSFIEMWDDRAVQVEFNTGERMDGGKRGVA